MAILVSGGAGYIGSHTCVELINAGYEILIADNFCNSSRAVPGRLEQITGKPVSYTEIDLTDREAVERLFNEHPEIDAVIHFAGLKAVGESCREPLRYYRNNLDSTLALLEAMDRHNVRRFVFSSSATVYGNPESCPIREDFPLSATNPYGYSKLCQERILSDLHSADPRWNIALLRYFNPIGAHESGLIGEDPCGIPNNLVPYVAKVAAGELDKIRIFGSDWPTKDGTGIRDYIHVTDLALGHVAALKKLETNCGLIVCNLGTGKGYSVLDVIHAYEEAVGFPLPYEFVPRRDGDIAVSYADPTRARELLGWEAKRGLREMCASSRNWQQRNPGGYPKI